MLPVVNRRQKKAAFGAGACGVIAASRSRPGERCASGGSRQKLDAEVLLKPGKTAAHDELGDSEALRCRGGAAEVSDLNERPRFFHVHSLFPGARHSALEGKATARKVVLATRIAS